MARHPNRQELTMWLDGSNTALDDHIHTCEVCASSLGDISEPETADLKPALLRLLKPPDDLHDRVSARIARRLQDRRDADLFGAMLGVPVEASRLFFDRDPDADVHDD